MTPMTEVQVSGNKGNCTIKAIVDTGFEGFLCIPVDIAVALGLELSGETLFEFADGSQKKELTFKGFVNFLGKRRKVDISLTKGEALVGTELLAECRLLIDFPKNEVRLSRQGMGPKNKRDR